MESVWDRLGDVPLLWLTVTVLAYVLADKLFRVSRALPIANPVLLSILVLSTLLLLSDTPYETYFADARPLHLLLGPATVALAVPLHAIWGKLREGTAQLLIVMLVGSIFGMLSAALPALFLGLNKDLVLTLLPKGVTTPIAIGIVEQIGGLPSLAAVLVILTGIFGATVGLELLTLAKVTNSAARGVALGLAAHGIATARAYQESKETGAFAGLAMGINGAITAVIAPLLAALLFGG